MDSVRLETVFYVHLCYFQLWGMCPTPVHYSCDRKRSFLLLVVSIVHVSLIVLKVVLVVHRLHLIFSAHDIFGRVNDIFKYFSAMVACFMITMESLLKRHQHRQFWSRLFAINVDFARQSGAVGSGHSTRVPLHRQFFLMFYGYFGLVFLVECAVLTVILNENSSLNFWGAYLVLLVMSRTRYLQYIMYVDTLDMQTANLQSELEKVVEYSKLRRLALGDPFNDTVLQFICKNVKWAQRYYSVLYEMAQNVNEAFGWSQLALFFHSFVQLMSDLYWIYWRYYNNYYYLEYVVLVIPTFTIVVLVLQRANKCHVRAQNIAFLVHSIKRTTTNTSLTTLVESFSLQILHQPIVFDAKGFFIMNFNPLRDMIAAITTYMVFFIQFTPKFTAR